MGLTPLEPSMKLEEDEVIASWFNNPAVPVGGGGGVGVEQFFLEDGPGGTNPLYNSSSSAPSSMPPSPPMSPALNPVATATAKTCSVPCDQCDKEEKGSEGAGQVGGGEEEGWGLHGDTLAGIFLALAASNAHNAFATWKTMRGDDDGMSEAHVGGGGEAAPRMTPGIIFTAVTLLLLVIAMLPIRWSRKRKALSHVWFIAQTAFPILFIIDDFYRTPEQIGDRITLWAAEYTLPFESACIYFGIGFVHNKLKPTSPVLLWLCLVPFLVVRYVYMMCIRPDIWRLPALGMATSCVPVALGYVAAEKHRLMYGGVQSSSQGAAEATAVQVGA